MASLLLIFNSLSPSLLTTPTRASFRPPHLPLYQGVHFSRKARGLTTGVVTRAGPTTSNYIFAFVLPLSLLAITVFASIKVADKLDDEFLEEVLIKIFIVLTSYDMFKGPYDLSKFHESFRKRNVKPSKVTKDMDVDREVTKFINNCNEMKAATRANNEGGQLSIVKGEPAGKKDGQTEEA
ncbi:hypothetical protein EZV62_017221 [Acer yangbiense]|uniref:Uncharacterized protein n=1 Tax=Acer yangbiense TaxID=1000413 RepID=A0A5C7HGK5_9ROSI|nr:hypothetical protein EZV62_017221 [Acer yangbiense]